ncbi:enolase C-terminal domain-like protein [Nonomuraea sp. bgisy101]|uniref:enolase C-terminal domain-like protein n=1 Tax=Nonomuraea sp. bgisy101 TaxID=3413784 RepID=UPI003D72E944
MRSTDVSVREAAAAFHDVRLDHPLRLSGATVDRFTLAVVWVTVEDRAGRVAWGEGASVLSVPWSWPVSELSWTVRDLVLRRLTERLAAAATEVGPGDPFAIHRELSEAAACARHDGAEAAGGPEPVPELAAALALGAVDNAVHDGWARAAGAPATSLYEGLDLGPARRRLPVQHVVGLDDPLEADPLEHPRAPDPRESGLLEPDSREPDAVESGPPDRDDVVPPRRAAVRPLREWLRAEGIAHVKIKLAGRDPAADARRVIEVHRVLRESAGDRHTVSLDPNEGYQEPAAVLELLDALDGSPAWDALTYLEQPVPRDAPPDPGGMRAIGARLPVLADESLATEADLARLAAAGWSGPVIKAARGQSLAMRSLAHARAHGMRVALQDLTAVGLALVHSARLAAVLPLDWQAFEYNSRQYAPRANGDLPAELVRVRQGHVVPGPARPGIH